MAFEKSGGVILECVPSKHAGLDSRPIRIGSEGLTRSEPDDSCTPSLASGLDPFGQNLTQSARTKSDTGWFCTV